MISHRLIQLATILFSTFLPVQSQECTLNCLKGICISSTYTLNGQNFQLDQCQCNQGWGGVLCDEIGKSCPDGTKCYNGSECAKRKDKTETKGVNQYYCDCKTAYDYSSFAGQMCEAPATQVCEYGVSVSKSAFCTNGGKCKEVVVKDSNGNEAKHPGCKCPDAFVGDHCEYLQGTEPETTSAPIIIESTHEGEVSSEKRHGHIEQSSQKKAQAVPDSPPPQTKSYVGVTVVASVCMVGILIAAGLLIRTSLKRRNNMKNPKPVINLATEAGVDDTGKKSKVVMNGETTDEDYEEIDII